MNTTPTAINASADSLTLTYADGNTATLSAWTLRAACSCALCVSEATGVRTLNLNAIAKDIKLTRAEPMGNYALALTFSDRHSTGIYSFEMLYGLS